MKKDVLLLQFTSEWEVFWKPLFRSWYWRRENNLFSILIYGLGGVGDRDLYSLKQSTLTCLNAEQYTDGHKSSQKN